VVRLRYAIVPQIIVHSSYCFPPVLASKNHIPSAVRTSVTFSETRLLGIHMLEFSLKVEA
jgi:hypothetical protein